jgi:hypothetical protein
MRPTHVQIIPPLVNLWGRIALIDCGFVVKAKLKFPHLVLQYFLGWGYATFEHLCERPQCTYLRMYVQYVSCGKIGLLGPRFRY